MSRSFAARTGFTNTNSLLMLSTASSATRPCLFAINEVSLFASHSKYTSIVRNREEADMPTYDPFQFAWRCSEQGYEWKDGKFLVIGDSSEHEGPALVPIGQT